MKIYRSQLDAVFCGHAVRFIGYGNMPHLADLQIVEQVKSLCRLCASHGVAFAEYADILDGEWSATHFNLEKVEG